MNIFSVLLFVLLLSAGCVCAETYHSFEDALDNPRNATVLAITEEDRELKHLPTALGSLTNLKELDISCMEELAELPKEIGNLIRLEKLIANNGNGCVMNVQLPEEVGRLKSLKKLELYGALDAGSPTITKTPLGMVKPLPITIGNLRNLEELNIGRNGLKTVPTAISSLVGSHLKTLNLEYNDLREIPSFLGNLDRLEELNLNFNWDLRVIPEEIGNLKHLKILSLSGNGGAKLPYSIARIKGLKIQMGNNSLTLRQQKDLRAKFPDAKFSFENEWDTNENEVTQK